MTSVFLDKDNGDTMECFDFPYEYILHASAKEHITNTMTFDYLMDLDYSPDTDITAYSGSDDLALIVAKDGTAVTTYEKHVTGKATK